MCIRSLYNVDLIGINLKYIEEEKTYGLETVEYDQGINFGFIFISNL